MHAAAGRDFLGSGDADELMPREPPKQGQDRRKAGCKRDFKNWSDTHSSKVQRAETINDMFKPRVDAPHEALGGPPKPKTKKGIK